MHFGINLLGLIFHRDILRNSLKRYTGNTVIYTCWCFTLELLRTWRVSKCFSGA